MRTRTEEARFIASNELNEQLEKFLERLES